MTKSNGPEQYYCFCNMLLYVIRVVGIINGVEI